MLLEGLKSGDSIPVDEKFWNDLKREAITKLAARKKRPKIMMQAVTLRPRARIDLQGAIRLSRGRSERGFGRALLAAVDETCALLVKHPLMGASYDSGVSDLEGMRRIFYRSRTGGINVVRLLHPIGLLWTTAALRSDLKVCATGGSGGNAGHVTRVAYKPDIEADVQVDILTLTRPHVTDI